MITTTGMIDNFCTSKLESDMATLDLTPYRVFYLINKNRDKFVRMNPNGSEDHSDDYKRVTVRVRFTKENQFDSVKLVVITYLDNDYCSDDTKYEEFSWNAIDEDVVELIKSYYRDHEKEYQRIINYADRIQAMYENPNNLSFTCDNEGRPRVAISGLPYIRNDEVLDVSVILSSLNDSCYNIFINDQNLNFRYQSNSFTNDELYELISKAKKYDQLRDMINGFVDDPEIAMRFSDSMMHTPYNRW